MSKITARTFRYILTATLVAPILLVGLCAVILALITSHLLQVIQMDRYSIEVLSASHEWEKLMIDMETGTRGYLMTDDSRFLEPYNRAAPQVESKLEKLLQLISDNPTQTSTLNGLKPLVANWRNLAADAKAYRSV